MAYADERGRDVGEGQRRGAGRCRAGIVSFLSVAVALLLGCSGEGDANPQGGATEDATGSAASPTDITGPPGLEIDLGRRGLRALARLTPPPPVPADPTNAVADDPRAKRLGQWLFFDGGLSSTGEISCATCHDPERAFSDGLAVPNTLGEGARRTPSLWNVGHGRWFFWDGRADSLWSQALGPIENPIEMGLTRGGVAHRIAGDAALRSAYEELFGSLPALDDAQRFPTAARPVPGDGEHPHARAWAEMATEDRDAVDHLFANVGKAIAAYERELTTGEAPFDRFARAVLASANGEDHDPADLTALSPSAQRGLSIFLGRGRCTLCHTGPLFTDGEFHNTSAPPRGGGDPKDPGRYRGIQDLRASPFGAAGPHSDDPEGEAASRVRHLAQSSETWGEFKTPSLRNVVGRGPYMHAGQFATLEEVLRFYSTLEGAAGRSHHQEQVLVPFELSERDTADLLAFLGSLTGPGPDPRWLVPPPSPGL